MENRTEIIGNIREFNRHYTVVLDLLNRHVLGSGYSLAEARLLYELSESGPCIANELAGRLQMDKSYLSRLLAGFERKGLVRREPVPRDSRASAIVLTQEGAACLRDLSARSDRHIRGMLHWLSDRECAEVLQAMDGIRKRLAKAADFAARPYTKADLPFIINGQLELYDAEYGFTSPVWKEYVAQAVHRLDAQFDAALDQMVILEYRGEAAGCIAVAHAGEGTAQLRFFFLKPAARGLGVGGRLLETALLFCREKNYRRVFLLTSDKLDAARYLYAKHGFRLTEAHHNADWGAAFIEERWDLELT